MDLKTILSSIFVGIISAVLLLLISMIPLLNVSILLFPIPFIVVGVKKGIKAGVVSLAVTCFIIGILIQPLFGIAFGLMSFLLVVGVSYGIKKRLDFHENIFISFGAVILSIILLMGIYALITGKNIFDYFLDSTKSLLLNENIFDFEKFQELNKQLGETLSNFTTKEQLAGFIVNQMRQIIPSSLILFSLIYGSLIFLFSRLILKKLKEKVPYVPPFDEWKLPRGLIWGFLLMLLASYLGSLINSAIFESVQMVISSLIVLVLTIQGLAVVWFFLKMWNAPSFIRWIIIVFVYVFVHMIFTLNTGLVLVGMLEQLFNIRKNYRNKLIKS